MKYRTSILLALRGSLKLVILSILQPRNEQDTPDIGIGVSSRSYKSNLQPFLSLHLVFLIHFAVHRI